MHPLILKRVIGHEGSDLQICPAILLDYTRHHVQHADYPGILPYSQSVSLFKEDLEREERCVRGSLVTGLSDTDLHLLDEFEGDVGSSSQRKDPDLNLDSGIHERGCYSAPDIPLDFAFCLCIAN